jgi:hypothetical protein
MCVAEGDKELQRSKMQMGPDTVIEVRKPQ